MKGQRKHLHAAPPALCPLVAWSWLQLWGTPMGQTPGQQRHHFCWVTGSSTWSQLCLPRDGSPCITVSVTDTCPRLVAWLRGRRQARALALTEPHPGSSKKGGVKRPDFGLRELASKPKSGPVFPSARWRFSIYNNSHLTRLLAALDDTVI